MCLCSYSRVDFRNNEHAYFCNYSYDPYVETCIRLHEHACFSVILVLSFFCRF
jgi:hypothetical protein